MSAVVICVASISGIPIFIRKRGHGSCENLPFSTVGSLNGVYMFGKPFGLELITTLSDDYCAVWEEFNDSITLIGIASGCSSKVLSKVLRSIFNAIILIIGEQEVKSLRNIERIKRDLRICYPVIDRLVNSLDFGNSNKKHSSDIVGVSEVMLTSENHLLQIVLDSFTECVDSAFSCIVVKDKIAVATESWWSLHPEEVMLLLLLASVESDKNSKDVPVFLPYKSPGVPFRFVVCTLVQDVKVCCLCGPTPVLTEVEYSASQCFKNSSDILNSALQCHPRNFPDSLTVDSGVLGFLFVSAEHGKFLISKNTHSSLSKKTTNSSHRLDILKTFFYQAVANNLVLDAYDKYNVNGVDLEEKLDIDIYNEAKETYWCSEYHKCHALKFDRDVLCLLCSSSVPTHALKLLTQNLYKTLTSDKHLCW